MPSHIRASPPLRSSSTSALASSPLLAHNSSADISSAPLPPVRFSSSLRSLANFAQPLPPHSEFELSVLNPPQSGSLQPDNHSATADIGTSKRVVEPISDTMGRHSNDSMGASTPDQPLLGGEFSHSTLESLRSSFDDAGLTVEHGEARRRLSSASSSGELTEFERAWSQRQRGFQVLALVCTLLISGKFLRIFVLSSIGGLTYVPSAVRTLAASASENGDSGGVARTYELYGWLSRHLRRGSCASPVLTRIPALISCLARNPDKNLCFLVGTLTLSKHGCNCCSWQLVTAH
ncbi:hypothetical protein IWW41_001082 [Coemansia sp. RSA 2522]|nr:hypothetical protein GGH97_000958 [Coemansia sp. RSA 475]KAJ2435101.1 hypothetical protein IWW41_001082 [Coemansia sp. RSA 2522]